MGQNLNFSCIKYCNCILCKKQVNINAIFCEKCYSDIHFISNSCKRCGEPISLDILNTIYCKCFIYKNWFLDNAQSIFLYRNLSTNLVMQIKKTDNYYIYQKLSDLAIKNCKHIFNNIDIIIPIPMHWFKKLIRGFNQSAILAEHIANKTQIYLSKNLIYKKNFRVQHTRSFSQRFTNIKNSFKINGCNIIKNKNILLIDDVITTGATSNECARLLKINGANSVKLLTLARTIL